MRAGEEPIPGYRLQRLAGRGAFGEVWKCSGPGGTKAALKFLNLNGRDGLKEFRAVQAIKQIRHPNLMPITGIWLFGQDGRLLSDDVIEQIADGTISAEALAAGNDPSEMVLSMLLADQDLIGRMLDCREKGQVGIPPVELLGYLEDAARGIDFLNSSHHDLGDGPVAIQHGDIKPQNIMLVGGAAQVCDFGLARVLSTNRVATATHLNGSPAYISPECIEHNLPSHASDQYSLAITYCELRTGQLPFDDTTFVAVMNAHTKGRLNLNALPEVEREVIRKATALNPADRFPNTVSMVWALRRAGNFYPGEGFAPLAPVAQPPAATPAPPQPKPSQPAAPTKTAPVAPDDRFDSAAPTQLQPIVNPPADKAGPKLTPVRGTVGSDKSKSAMPVRDTPVTPQKASDQSILDTPKREAKSPEPEFPSVSHSDEKKLAGGLLGRAAALLGLRNSIDAARKAIKPAAKQKIEPAPLAPPPEPAKPKESAKPVEALKPNVKPAAPMNPAPPTKPAPPVKPVETRQPAASLKPAMPTKSPASSKPAAPANPAPGTKPQPGVKQSESTIVSGIGMQLRRIPAGTFTMGSPMNEPQRARDETQHRVTLSRDFYLGVYPVTQGEFEQVTGKNPSSFSIKGEGHAKVARQNTRKYPVEQVLWLDAVDFCNKLSRKDRLPEYYRISGSDATALGGNGYRLPTEAEWEYACRAGTTTPFHFGATHDGHEDNIDGLLPYGASGKGICLDRTTEVGSYRVNAWGLYDLHGNVYEWCADWYGDYPTGNVVDPQGPATSKYRVLRGGSWGFVAKEARSAARHSFTPSFRYSVIGFRVARNA